MSFPQHVPSNEFHCAADVDYANTSDPVAADEQKPRQTAAALLHRDAQEGKAYRAFGEPNGEEVGDFAQRVVFHSTDCEWPGYIGSRKAQLQAHRVSYLWDAELT